MKIKNLTLLICASLLTSTPLLATIKNNSLAWIVNKTDFRCKMSNVNNGVVLTALSNCKIKEPKLPANVGICFPGGLQHCPSIYSYENIYFLSNHNQQKLMLPNYSYSKFILTPYGWNVSISAKDVKSQLSAGTLYYLVDIYDENGHDNIAISSVSP